MKITLKKKALLYDIGNIAYVIADTGETRHTLHRVTDICQEGNIDRVSRILGLSFSKIQDLLNPILHISPYRTLRDFSSIPHDYTFNLKECISPAKALKIKETAHEYMVCTVLADWLSITFPEESSRWEKRADKCLETLLTTAAGATGVFTRKVLPL